MAVQLLRPLHSNLFQLVSELRVFQSIRSTDNHLIRRNLNQLFDRPVLNGLSVHARNTNVAGHFTDVTLHQHNSVVLEKLVRNLLARPPERLLERGLNTRNRVIVTDNNLGITELVDRIGTQTTSHRSSRRSSQILPILASIRELV